MDDLLCKIALLHKTTLFSDLTLDVLQEIAYKAQYKKVLIGETIFSDKEVCNAIYIISSGKVSLQQANKEPLLLKEHDFFGEAGLLSNTVISTTAIALESSLLLYLDIPSFSSLIAVYPEVLSKVIHKVVHDLKQSQDPERFFKSQGFYTSALSKLEARSPKTLASQSVETQDIFNVLRQAPLFNGLSDKNLLPIAKKVKWRHAKKGETLFSVKDKPDYMYVIASGSVFIQKDKKDITLLNGHDFFGEMGIISNQPRKASVIAVEDSSFLLISKNAFKTILSKHPSIGKSILFKMLSYHYPDYQLQDENVLFQIERLLPASHQALDPKLFFESLGLTKSKTLTVVDLHGILKKDSAYKIGSSDIIAIKQRENIPILKKLATTDTVEPEHTNVEAVWEFTPGEKGTFTLPSSRLNVPVVTASEEALAYYGVKLLHQGEDFIFADEELPLWSVFIGEEYLHNFITTKKGGGALVECQLDRPHLYMPANAEACGCLILGKKIQGTPKYTFTAFKVPFGKALYIGPGIIHCDAALQGNWIIGCSNTSNGSSAVMKTDKDKLVTLRFTATHVKQRNIVISIHPKK